MHAGGCSLCLGCGWGAAGVGNVAGRLVSLLRAPPDSVTKRIALAPLHTFPETLCPPCCRPPVQTFKADGPLAFYNGFSSNFARLGAWK